MKISPIIILVLVCKMTLAQNVGIGVTTPQAKLDVANSLRVGGSLTFIKYDSVSATLSVNNSLLIGNQGPFDAAAAALDVRKTIPAGTAVFRGTNNWSLFNSGDIENTYIRGGKPGSHVIINDMGANVGIGTSSPQAKLDVAGTIKISGGSPGLGKILTSDHSGHASWGERIRAFFFGNTFGVDVTSNFEYALGNPVTINVNASSRLVISATVSMENACPFIGTCDGRAIFYIKIDGAQLAATEVKIKSIGEGWQSGTLANIIFDVTAGSHQLQLFTRKDTEFGSVNYLARAQSINVLVVPH